METAPVEICYRPLRIAWAIHSTDKECVRRAASVSHTLWRGRFNSVSGECPVVHRPLGAAMLKIVGGNMKLVHLRLSNFRSFGADYTELDLDDLTFLLGPNGAGKTAVLQALARMFSLDPTQRKVKKSDFYAPQDAVDHGPRRPRPGRGAQIAGGDG